MSGAKAGVKHGWERFNQQHIMKARTQEEKVVLEFDNDICGALQDHDCDHDSMHLASLSSYDV